VFAARYELNSYIVFRKRLVSKGLISLISKIIGREPCRNAAEYGLNLKQFIHLCYRFAKVYYVFRGHRRFLPSAYKIHLT
jgi:hypothetical protein